MAKIVAYQAKWNPATNQGIINFRDANNNKAHLNFTEATEFTAVLLMLSSSNEVDVTGGVISTGTEAVD